MNVEYQKAANGEEAYNTAKEQITPEYVQKFGVKADVDFDDSGKKISATGKGFTLNLVFYDNHCKVDLDLSFMLKPFKGKVLEGIESKLKRHV